MKEKSNMWLFKYLWIIAILPKEIQFVVLALLAVFLLWKKKGNLKFDSFSLMILGYASVHVISIFYNLLLATYEVNRIIAALNTVMVWYIAVFFYLYYKNSNIIVNKLGKYCFINNSIMILLVLVARYIGQNTMKWALPKLGNYLYHYEFPYSRFEGFLEYPTLVVAFVVMMLPWAIGYLATQFTRNICMPVVASYYMVSFLPVYFCYSRVGYVLMLIGMIGMVYLYWKEKMENRNRLVLIIVIVILLLAGLVPLYDYIVSIVTRLLLMRKGSNGTRLLIYKESIQYFLKSPFIGCGIKKIGKTGYPLGSHSSYIGFLYKTGISGTLLVMSAFFGQVVTLIKKCIWSQNFRKSLCIFFMLLMYGYCILEDIDGVDWLVCIWFAVIGILNGNIFVSPKENCNTVVSYYGIR